MSVGDYIEGIKLDRWDEQPGYGLYDDILKSVDHLYLLRRRIHTIPAVKITVVSPRVS